ncbi:hypothetical protein HK104_006657, partial [Borealophlyctis nickersoniae]
TGRKWYLLVDALQALLEKRVARREFTQFLRKIQAGGDINKFFGGFLGAGTYVASLLMRTPEPSPLQSPAREKG